MTSPFIEPHAAFTLSPTLAINETIARYRAEGRTIMHMGFGESPFPVPEKLAAALRDHAGAKSYLAAAGLPALRTAVAGYYEHKNGLNAADYDVLIAPGSKLALYALQMAIKGDLIMPVPSWVSYEPQAGMIGHKVIKISADLSQGDYRIDPQALRAVIREARAAGLQPGKIILNSPNNPTGLTMPAANMQEIAHICRAENIFIISDEIYGFTGFDGAPASIAAYAPEQTVITSGLSKHLSLGGWRIGIALVPRSISGLFERLGHIASETWSCVPAPIQQAATYAYSGDEELERHITACTAIHGHINRHIAAGLRALGVIAPAPQGAFYNYPDFTPHRAALNAAGIRTSRDLANCLINEYNLATLPGLAFGAPEESLTLRLAGCDYDGAAALAAYQGGATLDQNFIETTPRACIARWTALPAF